MISIGSCTPWGEADHIEVLAPGITRVDTPSHGGIHLSKERIKEMPKWARKGPSAYTPDEWFEEDAEVAYVYLAFPELFPTQQAGALNTAKIYYPDLLCECGRRRGHA